jgi:hypothetical protein
MAREGPRDEVKRYRIKLKRIVVETWEVWGLTKGEALERFAERESGRTALHMDTHEAGSSVTTIVCTKGDVYKGHYKARKERAA